MPSFTREELLDFYMDFEPNLKEGTFGWRIYDLKKKNIIKPLKRGLYVICNKPKYKPEISPETIKLAGWINKQFEDVKQCIWETVWLNEISQHQASKPRILIEIEKGFEESLFFGLKDTFGRDIYLKPDEKAIEFYISESNNPIIVKNLITRSPISKRRENEILCYTPTLEKILVDLYVDGNLFYYLQGSELIHIYENAITSYTIDFTKLFSYAKRRDREQEIKQFMTNHMYHLVKGIIDD